MQFPAFSIRDWDRRPSASCTAATTALPAGTTEVSVVLDGTTPLAALTDHLQSVRGLWLAGAVTADDLRTAARLPSLVELQIRAALTREMVLALAARPFERLLLSHFDAADLDALAGAKARDLALAVTGQGSTEAWAAVCALPLDRLHLKLARTELPVASIEAIARTGTLRRLSTIEASLSAAAIEALGDAHSLELVSLTTFGAPGCARIAKNRGLRELELITTQLDAVVLEELPMLEHVELQHAGSLTLRDLPRLSLVGVNTMFKPVSVSIEGMPALEQLVFGASKVGALSIAGAPRLHRIDARGEVTDAAVLATARTFAPDVLVTETRAKAKKVGEKRKVKWTNPQLGLGPPPRAVLIAGRVAEGPYAHGRAKDLATVGEWWAQKLGVHVACAVPQVLDPNDSASGLVFGRVLAIVDALPGAQTLELPLGALAAAERALEEIWPEASGVLGDEGLFARPFGLYLVTCGAGAFVPRERVQLDRRWHAALTVGSETVATSDPFSLPWRRVEVAEGASLTLSTKAGARGA